MLTSVHTITRPCMSYWRVCVNAHLQGISVFPLDPTRLHILFSFLLHVSGSPLWGRHPKPTDLLTRHLSCKQLVIVRVWCCVFVCSLTAYMHVCVCTERLVYMFSFCEQCVCTFFPPSSLGNCSVTVREDRGQSLPKTLSLSLWEDRCCGNRIELTVLSLVTGEVPTLCGGVGVSLSES